MLNWNGWPDTLQCLDSLAQLDYPRFRILVIDNGSTDDSLSILKGRQGFELLCLGQNLGFAGGMNRGIVRLLEAGCDLILLLNNDTVIAPAALRRLVEAAEACPRAGLSAESYDLKRRPTEIRR